MVLIPILSKSGNSLLALFITILLTSCSDFKGNSEQEKNLNRKPPSNNLPNKPVKLGTSHKLSGDKFNLEYLVEDLLFFVINPTLNNFVYSIQSLDETIQNNCVLSAYTSNESQVEAAVVLKIKWKNSMELYHQLEPLQIGPLAENNFELLDKIYSFPSTNFCGIDIEIYRKMTEPDYKLTSATNKLGLDAIEYILFQNDFKHGCSKNSKSIGNWEQLDSNTKNQARCSYLKSLSTEIKQSTYELHNKWKNFLKSNKSDNYQNLFNDIFFAMYFIEKNTKDQVVGVPTGLSKKSTQCFSRFCTKKVEHIDSHMSKKQILANVKTIDALFSGIESEKNEGFGIYDLLESKNDKFSSNVSKNIKRSLSYLITQLNKLPENFNIYTDILHVESYDKCTQSNKKQRFVESCSLYHDLKELSQLLKIDLPVALSVKLPVDTEGDGD